MESLYVTPGLILLFITSSLKLTCDSNRNGSWYRIPSHSPACRYRRNHPIFHVNTPHNASNHNEIKYRTTPFIVCIYPSCIPLFVCIVRKKKVSKSINIIFCPEKKLYLQHWKWLYVNILYLWTTIYLDNIPIVLHLGILFIIRL